MVTVGAALGRRRARGYAPAEEVGIPSTRKKKRGTAPASRGLAAETLASDSRPSSVNELAQTIERDGGSVLAAYRDPLGGYWQLLAGLPIEQVEPTPYQRDLSQAHVSRLASAIQRLDRFLDPIVAVRASNGKYWTPNGYHRLAALKELGARSVTALVVPEIEVAHRILLLNTEKAHNLRERALEVIRLAQSLAELDDRPEKDFEAEFEEPALLTLGLCYQENGRFAGGVYHPVVRRVEKFMSTRLSSALDARLLRAVRLLDLDEQVNSVVADLKARGFESPYLKAFVVARINPLRFKRGVKAEFDETLDQMFAGVERFDAAKIRADQVARTGGAPPE